MQCQGAVGIMQPLSDQGGGGLALRAPAAELAVLFDGRPIIVAESRLPDSVALNGIGARLCHAHFLAEGVTLRLRPPAGEPEVEEALEALAHPPAAVLALVAQTPRGMQALAGWWRAHGLEPPAIIVAESGLAALPELFAVALAEADDLARRAGELDRRCVALREEVEELRAAMAGMLGSAAGRPPPAAETRLRLVPDAEAPPLRLLAGEPPRLVATGLPSPGVARLSLHVAEAATAGLAVRLIGAESGRVLGAWRVPADAMPEGWLQLETPEPIQGRAETLMLELAAEGEAAEVALSAATGEPDAPALAIASLPPGSSLVQPLHMDWTAWQGDAPAAAPRLAPAQVLAGARLDGPGALDDAADGARRLTLPATWSDARLVLGPLPAGFAALRCDLRLEGGAAEARLALADGTGATGWRLLRPREARSFALALGEASREVFIELRGLGATAIDIAVPVLFPLAPLAPAPAAEEPPPPPAPPQRVVQAQPVEALEDPYPHAQWPVATRAEGEEVAGLDGKAHYAAAVLDARQSGTGWALLDLRLRGLSFRGERWREVKFKFGVSGENATLEFRRAPSWPRAFEAWPGTDSDAFGDKFVLVMKPDAVDRLERVAPGRDAALIAALAAVMPRLVAEVAGEGDDEGCAAAAERLAQRLGAEG